MNRKQIRAWWKVASFVAGKLHHSPDCLNLNRDTNRIRDATEQLEGLLRKLAIADSRNWLSAKQLLVLDLGRSVGQLEKLLDETKKEISDVTKQTSVTTGEVFLDLMALKQEFDDLCFDSKKKILSCVSKRIQLEDLDLGRFRIELHLETLSRRAYYEVIAIDANRANSNDGVTHPHIQDDRLCEGDAQPAIKLALQQGRLLDFFQIVDQVLSTYNASSAYVTIREWEGMICGHCGHSADRDETRECDDCEALICDGCVYCCQDCDGSFCGNCDVSCSDCLNGVCKSCITECKECDESFCSNCLTENGRCTHCEEKTKENSEAGNTGAEVHGQLVGETAVSP